MKENFLLKTDGARVLYESVKSLPIVDFHNHISVADIAKDRRYVDLYELWLAPRPLQAPLDAHLRC